MKQSIADLRNNLKQAEVNIKHYTIYAEKYDAEASLANRRAEANRLSAASEANKAADYRAAIALLEAALPVEKTETEGLTYDEKLDVATKLIDG